MRAEAPTLVYKGAWGRSMARRSGRMRAGITSQRPISLLGWGGALVLGAILWFVLIRWL